MNGTVRRQSVAITAFSLLAALTAIVVARPDAARPLGGGTTSTDATTSTVEAPTTVTPTTVDPFADFVTAEVDSTGRTVTVHAGYCLYNGQPYGLGHVVISKDGGGIYLFSTEGVPLDDDSSFWVVLTAPPDAPSGSYTVLADCAVLDAVVPIEARTQIELRAPPPTTSTTTAELPRTE